MDPNEEMTIATFARKSKPLYLRVYLINLENVLLAFFTLGRSLF